MAAGVPAAGGPARRFDHLIQGSHAGMSTTLTIVIVVILVVLVALIAFGALRMARTRRLRTRFGPEYERVAASAPNRNAAESELRARERRHEDLDIRPLDAASRDRYAREWAEVQERFVDAPARSIHDADLLVTELMRERGYPVEDFGQRLSDLSVRHGHTLEHYRQAHAISERITGSEAETEEMRQAMVHYREMFADLLVDGTSTDPNPATRDGRPDAAHEPEPAHGPGPGTAPGSAPGVPRGEPGPGTRPGVGARLRNLVNPDHGHTHTQGRHRHDEPRR